MGTGKACTLPLRNAISAFLYNAKHVLYAPTIVFKGALAHDTFLAVKRWSDVPSLCIDPVKPTHVMIEDATMSTKMEEDIKRWAAKRKSALVLDIIQGKRTVAEASR